MFEWWGGKKSIGGGLEAIAVIQSRDDSGLNKCANPGDGSVSCHFSGFAFTRFGSALPLAQQNVMPILTALLFRSPKLYKSMHQLQSLSFRQHWINLCST